MPVSRNSSLPNPDKSLRNCRVKENCPFNGHRKCDNVLYKCMVKAIILLNSILVPFLISKSDISHCLSFSKNILKNSTSLADLSSN